MCYTFCAFVEQNSRPAATDPFVHTLSFPIIAFFDVLISLCKSGGQYVLPKYNVKREH